MIADIEGLERHLIAKIEARQAAALGKQGTDVVPVEALPNLNYWRGYEKACADLCDIVKEALREYDPDAEDEDQT